MLPNFAPFFLFGTALLLGLRHGIDWDHIAAISDIVTSSQDSKQALFLGTCYAAGHGLVIIALGLGAVILGVKLPLWVDRVMEPIVGATLIFLSLYLIFSIVKHGKNVRLRSRWMVIFGILGRIYEFLESKITHKHKSSHFHYAGDFGIKSSFLVGIIHGIGAETPTQLLLFVTAAGAGGQVLGSMIVFTFVLGLILSNSLIIVLSILGIATIHQDTNIYLFLAGVTAFFSLTVGLFFLTGQAAVLPALLGG